MQDKERIIINDYIENDPLSENNLNNTLDLVNEFRLASPKKSIWLYTGYTIYFREELNKKILSAKTDDYHLDVSISTVIREKILEVCDIVVDGKYIDSQRDVTLLWCGSSNQKIIDIQESINHNKIILHYD